MKIPQGLKKDWPKYLTWVSGGLLVLVLIIGAIDHQEYAWAVQPVVMIVFSVVATQVGSKYAQKILQRLAESLSYKSRDQSQPDEIKSEEAETKELKTIRECIEDRLSGAKEKGHGAIDSYLNQVAGAWAMVLLIIGTAGMLIFRPWLVHIDNPPYVTAFAVFAISVTFILIFIVTTFDAVGTKKIEIYYGHKSKYPPSSALTFLRSTLLIIYSCLVFAGHWPNSSPIPKNTTHGTTPFAVTNSISSIGADRFSAITSRSCASS